MSNTERRQTGGRIGGSDFSSTQPTKPSTESAESAESKADTPELMESPNVFGNTIKFTKTVRQRND